MNQRTASRPRNRLSVVVIARNEERHIGQCLDALMHALQSMPGTPVILVDSGSTDRTVEIASAYPVEIYSYAGPVYSAAAGRRVGFERTDTRYVLFVDGDCCIEPGWIEVALRQLEHDQSAAVVYGARREVFEGTTGEAAAAAPAAKEYGLGGNALYRAGVLRSAGGFNPYLKAGEEAELLGRIVALGYHPVATPEVMFTHYTLPKSSVVGFTERLRRGLARGLGQTLRLGIRQGLFIYHARRLNRYLITLAYLSAGILALLASLVSRDATWFAAWTAAGLAAFALLCWKRRSVRGATYIVADWICIAVHLPLDFLRAPPDPRHFAPVVEHLPCKS
jgi:glycosyltransferase involved in cell wall biosynthesis